MRESLICIGKIGKKGYYFEEDVYKRQDIGRERRN